MSNPATASESPEACRGNLSSYQRDLLEAVMPLVKSKYHLRHDRDSLANIGFSHGRRTIAYARFESFRIFRLGRRDEQRRARTGEEFGKVLIESPSGRSAPVGGFAH